MIQQALEYLFGLGLKDAEAPMTVDIDGRKFWRSTGREVKNDASWPMLAVDTLAGLVECYNDIGSTSLFHVVNSRVVALVSLPVETGTDMERILYAKAEAPRVAQFRTGEYLPHEDFCIEAQAKFQWTTELAEMLSFVSGMQEDAAQTVNDDGVAQVVTVRRGVTSLQTERVKNPVTLMPRTTFEELFQPEHTYILRLKGGGDKSVPQVGLFAVDSSRPKLDAITSIKAWLRDNTTDGTRIIG